MLFTHNDVHKWRQYQKIGEMNVVKWRQVQKNQWLVAVFFHLSEVRSPIKNIYQKNDQVQHLRMFNFAKTHISLFGLLACLRPFVTLPSARNKYVTQHWTERSSPELLNWLRGFLSHLWVFLNTLLNINLY